MQPALVSLSLYLISYILQIIERLPYFCVSLQAESSPATKGFGSPTKKPQKTEELNNLK
jgi:hypothetical protein